MEGSLPVSGAVVTPPSFSNCGLSDRRGWSAPQPPRVRTSKDLHLRGVPSRSLSTPTGASVCSCPTTRLRSWGHVSRGSLESSDEVQTSDCGVWVKGRRFREQRVGLCPGVSEKVFTPRAHTHVGVRRRRSCAPGSLCPHTTPMSQVDGDVEPGEFLMYNSSCFDVNRCEVRTSPSQSPQPAPGCVSGVQDRGEPPSRPSEAGTTRGVRRKDVERPDEDRTGRG